MPVHGQLGRRREAWVLLPLGLLQVRVYIWYRVLCKQRHKLEPEPIPMPTREKMVPLKPDFGLLNNYDVTVQQGVDQGAGELLAWRLMEYPQCLQQARMTPTLAD